MNGKVYTVKPGIDYKTSIRRERAEEKSSLKDKAVDLLETALLLLLLCVFLVLTVAVAYKSIIYFKLKMEKRALSLERAQLDKELNQLTSREVLLEKARALGLRPPQDKEQIRLR